MARNVTPVVKPADLVLPVGIGCLVGVVVASAIKAPLWHQALGGALAGLLVAVCLLAALGFYDAWFGSRNRDR
jgi:hypothetical protein